MDPDNSIADLHHRVAALRRDLHAHPELAFDERRTSAMVAEQLARLGIWGMFCEAPLARFCRKSKPGTNLPKPKLVLSLMAAPQGGCADSLLQAAAAGDAAPLSACAHPSWRPRRPAPGRWH